MEKNPAVPGRFRKYHTVGGDPGPGDYAADGARIWEMIRAGEPIVCEMERGKNRYDQTTHYARYRRQA